MKNDKKILIISLTRTGNLLNQQVQEKLNKLGYEAAGYTTPRLAASSGLPALKGALSDWVGSHWGAVSFLFIGAAGIAMRSVAAWIRDKYTDSAVIVMDEKGEYVIPLLSGHIGGAVAVSQDIAVITGGTAVITTATDVQAKFAVDVFASNHNLQITDRQMAKAVSAAILEGESVGFYDELSLLQKVPKELKLCRQIEELKKYCCGIAVVKRMPEVMCPHVLYLIDESAVEKANIIVGIGCRKGTAKEHLENTLQRVLTKHGLRRSDIAALVSIDLKKNEPGLLALAKDCGVSLHTYTATELQQVETVSTTSAFVKQVVGVDNVCERAARYHCPEGKVIQYKEIVDGVTFALVQNKAMEPCKQPDAGMGAKRILIFAGTTEGRELYEALKEGPYRLYLSVATEYGQESAAGMTAAQIVSGRMDVEEIIAFMKAHQIDLAIDATHPFAEAVTANVKCACQAAGTTYLRCLRTDQAVESEHIIRTGSLAEAVAYLKTTTGNILISTGSKELAKFTEITDYRERCYARVLSVQESVAESVRLGFTGRHLLAMQGPFSVEMNIAAIHHTKAQYFVTKESGTAGGVAEKVKACEETGIKLVMITRPQESGMTVQQICAWIRNNQNNYQNY